MESFGIIFKKNVEIKVRDGTILRANLFLPSRKGRYPAILLRTPYRKPESGYERFVMANYAVVCQDIRGRYDSEGEYVPFFTSHHREAEDGYDTVEWIANQQWCDGNIGTMGISYPAWLQYQLAKLQPLHLKAMSALSIPVELQKLDFPYGSFKPGRRLSFLFNAIAPDIRRKKKLPEPHTPEQALKIWDKYLHESLIWCLPLSDAFRYLPEELAEHVYRWLNEPFKNVWHFEKAHSLIEVPNLDFTGWYDHCWSFENFSGLRNRGKTQVARKYSKIVIGPWNHIGLGSQKCGEIDFGRNAVVDIQSIQIQWFDHWLKGIENKIEDDPPVRYYVIGADKWKHCEVFPPETKPYELFLSSGGNLSSILRCKSGNAKFTYDPKNPVPSLWTINCFSSAYDLNQLGHRQDILCFFSKPLKNDIEIVGYAEVVIYVNSSAPDTDFFVRLADDNPSGFCLEVSSGMIRVRYRDGFEKENFISKDEIVELRIRMSATACRFKRGNRIALLITSSNFPEFDRNHNTGKNDIFDSELKIAKQTIFFGKRFPSRIILPVVKDGN